MTFHYNTSSDSSPLLIWRVFCLIAQTILTPEEMAFSPSATDTEAKMLFLLTVIKWVSAKKAEHNAAAATPNQTYEGKNQVEQNTISTRNQAYKCKNQAEQIVAVTLTAIFTKLPASRLPDVP